MYSAPPRSISYLYTKYVRIQTLYWQNVYVACLCFIKPIYVFVQHKVNTIKQNLFHLVHWNFLVSMKMAVMCNGIAASRFAWMIFPLCWCVQVFCGHFFLFELWMFVAHFLYAFIQSDVFSLLFVFEINPCQWFWIAAACFIFMIHTFGASFHDFSLIHLVIQN